MTTNFRADYTHTVEEGVIVIVDLDRGNRSVTNDIDNVLQDIRQELGDLSGYAVVYRDSEGHWDGVRLDEKGIVHLFLRVRRRDRA